MMAGTGLLGDYKGSQAREVVMTLEEYQAMKKNMIADEVAGYADLTEGDEGDEDEYEYVEVEEDTDADPDDADQEQDAEEYADDADEEEAEDDDYLETSEYLDDEK